MAAPSEGAGCPVGHLPFLGGITQVTFVPPCEVALQLEILGALLSGGPGPGLGWPCVHRISWETGAELRRNTWLCSHLDPGCQETFRSLFNLYFPIGWGCLGIFPPKRNWNQKHSDEVVSRGLEIYFCIVFACS